MRCRKGSEPRKRAALFVAAVCDRRKRRAKFKSSAVIDRRYKDCSRALDYTKTKAG